MSSTLDTNCKSELTVAARIRISLVYLAMKGYRFAMRRFMPLTFAFVLVGLLAACGTPQEQCIQRASKDLRKLDALIEEVRMNIARGYAKQEETYTTPVWQVCAVRRDAEGNIIEREYCWRDQVMTREKDVPIDPAVEKRKLAGLERKRESVAKATRQAIATCRATYPE